MCYSHRHSQPIPISVTYWIRSLILRYPLQQTSSMEGFVSACYYHHHSQPYTDDNTTQSTLGGGSSSGVTGGHGRNAQ